MGSDQSTILGTGSFFSPSGYESLPSGNAADDAKFAAAAAKDKGAVKMTGTDVDAADRGLTASTTTTPTA